MVCTTYKNCDLGDGWVLFYPHYTRSMKNLKMCRVDQNQHHPTPKDLEVTGRLCRIYSSSSWKNMSICLGKWCWPHGDLMVKNNPSRNFQNSEMGSILTIFHDFSSLSVQQRGPPGLRCACFKDLSTSNPLMFIFRYVWTCSVPLLFWSIGQLYTHISLSTIHFFGGVPIIFSLPQQWCGYGSIPINTIFSGNEHPFTSYFGVNYRGTRFWPTAMFIQSSYGSAASPRLHQPGYAGGMRMKSSCSTPNWLRPNQRRNRIHFSPMFLGKLWKTMENYGKLWKSVIFWGSKATQYILIHLNAIKTPCACLKIWHPPKSDGLKPHKSG